MTRTVPANAHLSNAQRDALKRAIAADRGWPDYSTTSGITMVRISSGTCLQVCQRLGIDAASVLDGAGYPYRGSTSPAAWASRFDALTAQPSAGATQQTVASPLDPQLAERVERVERQARTLNIDAVSLAGRVTELESVRPPVTLQVSINGGAAKVVNGHSHPLFPELLSLCAVRDGQGQRLNIWIAGPTGSGKTYAAKQVAEVLGYPFDFHGATAQAFQLVGYVSQATGQFVDTPFVRIFESGGIILLDELDAYENEALLALNAALANGMISLADGRVVTRHPDCVVIGAANTFGEGPSSTFVGRNKLDGAFLSRFAVALNWGYDLKFEETICGNREWARIVQHARRIAAENGYKVIIDPRQSIAGAALLAAGMPLMRVAELTFLSRMTDDQRLAMVANIAELF